MRPGAPPSRVAQAVGYRVRVEDLGGELNGWLFESLSVICVDATISARRREFTVAHEMMHAVARSDIPPEHLEAWCDRGAAALMMPRAAFLASGTACDWDLQVLRGWWAHCSPLAILRRVVDLRDGAAVSAWTRSRMRLRVGDLEAGALEEFIAAEAMQSGKSEIELGGVRVRAWRTSPGRALALALAG